MDLLITIVSIGDKISENSLRILLGILKGPHALEMFKSFTIFAISSVEISDGLKELRIGFPR